MLAYKPHRVIFDAQSFFERNKEDEANRFIKTLLKIIQKTRDFNIAVAFHTYQPQPLLDFLNRCNFSTFTFNTYADFSTVLDSTSILVTKDPIFYQFLKKYKEAQILTYVDTTFYFINHNELDSRYGYYYYEDYLLYTASIKSRRLNFPGVKQASLNNAFLFNRRIKRNTNTHRFYQRPAVFKPHYEKTFIDIKKKLFIDFNQVDIGELTNQIETNFPKYKNFLKRVKTTIRKAEQARINFKI